MDEDAERTVTICDDTEVAVTIRDDTEVAVTIRDDTEVAVTIRDDTEANHTCLICYDDFSPAEIVYNATCCHIMCQDCASELLLRDPNDTITEYPCPLCLRDQDHKASVAQELQQSKPLPHGTKVNLVQETTHLTGTPNTVPSLNGQTVLASDKNTYVSTKSTTQPFSQILPNICRINTQNAEDVDFKSVNGCCIVKQERTTTNTDYICCVNPARHSDTMAHGMDSGNTVAYQQTGLSWVYGTEGATTGTMDECLAGRLTNIDEG